LITDAQRAGLTESQAGWKLAPAIELDVVAVGENVPRDYAITETVVRPTADGTVRVLGKVRNWSDVDAEALSVTLSIDGEDVSTKTLNVNAHSASQVSFELPEDHAPEFDGLLEVDAGGPSADDRRYFSYTPPRQGRVAVVSATAEPERRSGAWFFAQALPESAKSPWRAMAVPVQGLVEVLADASRRPDAIVLTEDAVLNATAASALEQYLENGGQLLVAPGDAESLGPLASFLEANGIAVAGVQYERARSSQFTTLSWVDFDHPVFTLFQGTRYNDFSQVRMFNRLDLDVQDPARVIARFDDDAPAIVEAAVGDGRIIVWPFPVKLEWTNFPKTQRFVPVLFETLAYMSDWEELGGEYKIGETLVAAAYEYNEDGEAEVSIPGDSGTRTITVDTAGAIRLERPGIVRARPAGAAAWSLARPVNVNADEGDPERMEAETLLARVATSSVLTENTAGAGIVGTDIDAKGYVIDEEYGRWALIAVCALVLIECLYMSRLSAQRVRRTEGAQGLTAGHASATGSGEV
jgi:hypothetical protein